MQRWRWRVALALLFAAALGYGSHHPPLAYPVLVAAAAVVLAMAFRAPVDIPRVVAVRPGAAAVGPLARHHIADVAALHLDALPHGFFARLGHRFLRAYYEAFVASPHAIALVATTGEQPIGMVVGTARPRAHTRWILRRRGPRLALIGALALAQRPRLALTFARTRIASYASAWRRARRRERPAESDAPASRSEPAVLSHVAVNPGARGAGIGRELVEQFVAKAAEEAADRVVLTTIDGPAGAGPFYEREGWTAGGVRPTYDGQLMRVFTRPVGRGTS